MRRLIAAFVLTAIAPLAAAQTAMPASATPPPPCMTPENRQFDFWHGDWDAGFRNADGTTGTATNRVESILGGCVTSENFAMGGAQPFAGNSGKTWTLRWRINYTRRGA